MVLRLLPPGVRDAIEAGKRLKNVIPGKTKIDGKVVLGIIYFACWSQDGELFWDAGKTRSTLAIRLRGTILPGSLKFRREGSPAIHRGHGMAANT